MKKYFEAEKKKIHGIVENAKKDLMRIKMRKEEIKDTILKGLFIFSIITSIVMVILSIVNITRNK